MLAFFFMRLKRHSEKTDARPKREQNCQHLPDLVRNLAEIRPLRSQRPRCRPAAEVWLPNLGCKEQQELLGVESAEAVVETVRAPFLKDQMKYE